MSKLARSNVSRSPSPDPVPFFSATVNQALNPNASKASIPTPTDFRATLTRLAKENYPQVGDVWTIKARQTANDFSTTLMEIIFFVDPRKGENLVSIAFDTISIGYYSDPLDGIIHHAISGTIEVDFDYERNIVSGNFNALFDNGGEDGKETFPIVGQFLAYETAPSRR